MPETGDAIEIRAERVVVGRDKDVDVRINDKSVSRRHAVIERQDGGWLVSDQKSANGTFVNGTRVTRALLSEGQKVQFGNVAYTVSLYEVRTPVAVPGITGRTPVAGIPAVPRGGGRTGKGPAAAPAGTGSMTVEEAASMLGVYPGSPAHEVRRQYHKLYNDLQIRLTNAPAASLKRMYQKSLQDLKTAAEVLCPGQVF